MGLALNPIATRDVFGAMPWAGRLTRFVLYDFLRRDGDYKKDFRHDTHCRARHPRV